jgi:hypothetical protein
MSAFTSTDPLFHPDQNRVSAAQEPSHHGTSHTHARGRTIGVSQRRDGRKFWAAFIRWRSLTEVRLDKPEPPFPLAVLMT